MYQCAKRLKPNQVLGDGGPIDIALSKIVRGFAAHKIDPRNSGAGDHVQPSRATPPVSATITWINLTGLATFILATFFPLRFGLSLSNSLIVIMAAPALMIIILEATFIKSRVP